MTELIQKALSKVGYGHNEPTEANLVQCFLDFVDGGTWRNLNLEEAIDDIKFGEISIKDMCNALLKLR